MRRPPSRLEVILSSALVWVALALPLLALALSWSEAARAHTFAVMWAALYLRKSVELRSHQWMLARMLRSKPEETP